MYGSLWQGKGVIHVYLVSGHWSSGFEGMPHFLVWYSVVVVMFFRSTVLVFHRSNLHMFASLPAIGFWHLIYNKTGWSHFQSTFLFIYILLTNLQRCFHSTIPIQKLLGNTTETIPRERKNNDYPKAKNIKTNIIKLKLQDTLLDSVAHQMSDQG